MGGQVTGLVPVHEPLMHVKVESHRLLLVQAVPIGGRRVGALAAGGIAGAGHVARVARRADRTGLDPAQAPPWHV